MLRSQLHRPNDRERWLELCPEFFLTFFFSFILICINMHIAHCPLHKLLQQTCAPALARVHKTKLRLISQRVRHLHTIQEAQQKKKISQYAEWVCSIHFPIASATAPWYFQKWKFVDAASRNSSDGQQNLRYSPGVIRISPFSCMSWRRGQHSSASQQSHFTFNSRSLHKQETKQKKTDIFFFFSSDNFFSSVASASLSRQR